MGTFIEASRYHDFSCGHRVVGHESKCALLHGHNYRVHFRVTADSLDSVGRVMDFSVINERLCQWLEENWDHRFLAWEQDHVMRTVDRALVAGRNHDDESDRAIHSIVWVPFNPTAENMAKFLLTNVGPLQLDGTGVTLVQVVVEETRKCSAGAHLETIDVN